MIDSLIHYIREKGYSVDVRPPGELLPGRLHIWLMVGDQILAYDWCILKEELASLPWEILTWEADRRLGELTCAVRGAMRGGVIA